MGGIAIGYARLAIPDLACKNPIKPIGLDFDKTRFFTVLVLAH